MSGNRFSLPRLRFALGCYALVLPTVVLISFFIYLPVFWAFSKSLYQFEVGGTARFVGLRNYVEYLFHDYTLIPSFLNMAFLVCFALCVRLTMPLLVAKWIHSMTQERWRYLYRILFLLPIVVPGVAVQLIWRNLVYEERGLLNSAILQLAHGLNGLLAWVGLGAWQFSPQALTHAWLTDPATALWAVAIVGFPFVGGFEVLIFYAGLSNIPESVNEAALIEGCVGVRKFFRIDLPMLLSQIKLIFMLTVITGIQGFENILILTMGGPGFETMVPGFWMYLNAFSFQQMGYACAIGVLLFAIIFGLTLFNTRFFKSSEDVQSR